MNLRLNTWLKTIRSSALARNPWLMAALGFYLTMLVLASFKGLERSLIGSFNDKLFHLLTYMILCGLIYRGLQVEFLIERLLVTLGAVGVLAAIDELLQWGSSHRVSEFDAWLYDMAGAVLILALIVVLQIVRDAYRAYQERDLDSSGSD